LVKGTKKATELLLLMVADAGVRPLLRASAVLKASLELLMDESVAVQLRLFVGTVPIVPTDGTAQPRSEAPVTDRVAWCKETARVR
jgi:hypothetical protein